MCGLELDDRSLKKVPAHLQSTVCHLRQDTLDLSRFAAEVYSFTQVVLSLHSVHIICFLESRSQLPTTTVTTSFAGITSPMQTTPVNQPQPVCKSPNYGSYLSPRTMPSHNSPGRMSRSCEDVSQLPVGNKFPFQADNNAMSDFDNFFMSPLSPMKIDSCDTSDNSSLLFHVSSNAIPIPSSNSVVGKTDSLSWLDLSMSPTAQQNMQHGNAELLHNNNHKGTPPANLYDPGTAFKGDEHFPLSLFDLETPTALHPPSDFGETMDYCV